MRDMKTLNRYIPTLVKEKLDTLEYKQKEQLYCVCDMIFRSSIYRKDDDYSNRFIDIPSYYFMDIFYKYNPPINFLLENNIIQCDNNYSKEGGKCLGYRFNEEYISTLTKVSIQKTTIKKNIIKNRNKRNDEAKKALTTYKDFYLKEFDIDYNKALAYLNNWYETSMAILNDNKSEERINQDEWMNEYVKITNKYNSIFMSISAIRDGELFFKKNKTNGRIDTNLTSLKSEYKQFIKTDKELFSIDIVNSQPYMLSLLLDDVKDREEVQKYIEWTSLGQFYENFQRAVYTRKGKEMTRKDIKNMLFCIMYSKNNSFCKEKNVFKAIFPSILEHITNKKKKQHNKFAIELQKAESEICLDIIARELDSKGISYYTVHDSFIVDKKDIFETKQSIFNNFQKKYNSQPSLSTEKVTMG